ncbi:MAG: 3-oxoacyl-[acyl-carrier-protein] reductase FabG [Phycisphaerae bacterium]|nr:3-oxoacyl-[acyl-carrier-protein] reductase FabG [Phycisphaerae bacterium]
MGGKRALVTGAGRGIGRATAVQLARDGFELAIVARSDGELADTQREVKALGRNCVRFAADLSEASRAAEVVGRAVEALGRLDALVNNAGVAICRPFEEFSLEDYRASVGVNLDGVFGACHTAWPILVRQGGGVIVNVASVAAHDPFPGFAVYGATKAAVVLMSRALAEEGRPTGIRVYSVSPGAVETTMLRGAFPDFPREQCLSPNDVAKQIAALVDEACDVASGSDVRISR